MPEVLTFDNYEVLVVRSKRRRTASIKVDLEGVSIRVPQALPLAEIRTLIDSKQRWIENKLKTAALQRQALQAQAINDGSLGNGSTLLYQGRKLSLALEVKPATQVYRHQNQLIVQAPATVLSEPDELRALVEQWLYDRAVEELTFCVNVYKQKVGATPSRIQIKSYKARWGSCKPDQSIQLNWRLIHAPIHILDYVVVHELCHLLEMNHGTRFWSEVRRVIPDYEMQRRWLKDNGWQLTF
jgi:predicted metal-dependent hydrolase